MCLVNTIEAVCVDRRDVQKAQQQGLAYEDAVRKHAKSVTVAKGDPAYDSLEFSLLCVIDGVMYGKSVADLLGEE